MGVDVGVSPGTAVAVAGTVAAVVTVAAGALDGRRGRCAAARNEAREQQAGKCSAPASHRPLSSRAPGASSPFTVLPGSTRCTPDCFGGGERWGKERETDKRTHRANNPNADYISHSAATIYPFAIERSSTREEDGAERDAPCEEARRG
jgi:hypothetical protein